MATKVSIDDDIRDEAHRLGSLRTKKDTVDVALQEFIARRKRVAAIAALGTVEFRDDWDHKAARKRR